MTFMKTVCLDSKTFDNENYSYEDVSFGDYITFALWDITPGRAPCLIMCNDNTHTNIEAQIAAFIEGVKYCYDVEYFPKNILICENEYEPNLKTDKLIKC